MPNKQSVIVFGGTGKSGPFAVQRAVDEGYDVWAFVRTPSKLSEDLRKKVHVVQGDVLDRESVSEAIKDKDAVLSMIGTGNNIGPTTLMSEATKNIVSGMRSHGIKKLAVMLAVSSLPGGFVFYFLRHIYEDHKRIVDFLKEECSDIDWVMVHTPIVIRSSKINPGYLVERNVWTGRMLVNAGEVGDVMAKCVGDANTEYRHFQLGICSGPAYMSTFQLKAFVAAILLFVVGMILYEFNLS